MAADFVVFVLALLRSRLSWVRQNYLRATTARAFAAFEGWHKQVRRIIAAAETCDVWALFDRDPLP
jgi:hypothetical protein